MGHVNGSIHERSYRNQVVDTDIVSAFLETPSDKSTMKLIGHTSLTRDPNAPTKPTPAHRHQVQEDTEIIEARRLLDSQTQTIINRYRSLAQATRNAQHDLKIQAELDHHAQLKREHDALFKRKLRAVFEQSRKQYFETLGVICLQNKHTGNPEPPRPDEQPFRFREREDLIRLLFPRSLPTSPQQQVENSSKIIRLYASLCGRRESPRLRCRPEHVIPEPCISVYPKGPADVTSCPLDTDLDTYPLQCPGTQCLFCLGDDHLPPKSRTRCYARPYSLTRHVQDQHLRYHAEPFTCPHPSFSLAGLRLEDHDHFKSHALQVHHIVHCS